MNKKLKKLMKKLDEINDNKKIKEETEKFQKEISHYKLI